MPNEITWLQEPHVILSRVHGVLAVEELLAAVPDIQQRLDAAAHPVHLVVDVSELTSFPTSIHLLKRAMPFGSHPNMGWMVVYGASSLATTFAQIVMRITMQRYRMFDTREDALAFLAEQDAAVSVR